MNAGNASYKIYTISFLRIYTCVYRYKHTCLKDFLPIKYPLQSLLLNFQNFKT